MKSKDDVKLLHAVMSILEVAEQHASYKNGFGATAFGGALVLFEFGYVGELCIAIGALLIFATIGASIDRKRQ